MVLQKTVDNLKDRSKDERQVVAGGIAITVVIVLLVGWAVIFFKRVQSGSLETNFDSGAQSEFNFSATREAQQAIQSSQGSGSEDLSRLRYDAAAQDASGQIYLQEIDSGTGFGSESDF